MAADDQSKYKDMSILQWLDDVQAARSELSDEGLTSNPDSTDLSLQLPQSHHHHHHQHHSTRPEQHMTSVPLSSYLHHKQGIQSSTRSSSLSLPSKPSFLSRSHQALRSFKSVGFLSNDSSKKNSNSKPLANRSDSESIVATSRTSDTTHDDPPGKDGTARVVEEVVKCKREDGELLSSEVMIEEDCNKEREDMLVTRNRQFSFSPLPSSLQQLPDLPSFDISVVGVDRINTKRKGLSKKLPTVIGLNKRRPILQTSKLLRTSTSPNELTNSTKSAPTSPNLSTSKMAQATSTLEEGVSVPVLERRKSFSQDDINFIQSVLDDDVGEVSPLHPHSHDEFSEVGAPSSPLSLVVEGGSSLSNLETGSRTGGERVNQPLESSCPSSKAAVKDNSEGEQHHSSSRKDDLKLDKQLFLEDDDGKSKLKSDSNVEHIMLSSPSISLPRTPHSPLIRQRTLSRSPSPSYSSQHHVCTPPPPQSPPSHHHHCHRTSSGSAVEPENLMISKQSLKLLDECQTFSFDTSEDSKNLTSKQPKFLLKKLVLPMCPMSLPSSSQHTHSTFSLPLHHRHSFSDCLPGSSTAIQQQQQQQQDESQNQTTSSPPSGRTRSSTMSLTKVLLHRRTSSPLMLPLERDSSLSTKESPAIMLSATKQSLLLKMSGSSSVPSSASEQTVSFSSSLLQELNKKKLSSPPQERFMGTNTTTMATTTTTVPSDAMITGQTGLSGPSRWNARDTMKRQDSGIGTLSTTSNRFL